MAPRPDELQTRRSGPGRVPPHDLHAEESLLGAMMLSDEAIAAAAGVLSATDFYKPAHGHIFDAIHTLYVAGQPVDPVTVADELRRAGLLDAAGGPAVLAQIMSSTPATTNAARYARIVEDYALLRRLISVAGEVAEIGYSVPEDVPKALDHAEAMVYEVSGRRLVDTTSKLADLLSDNLDRLEHLYERGDAITGVPTGYIDLDQLLSGLQPSALIVVGARPTMGKCVAWDTPIVDPETGAVRTAAALYRAGKRGARVSVLALDAPTGPSPALTSAAPSAYVDDGVKPVYRVRTRLGREVRTTASHPFLTPAGWRSLASLSVGDTVGVPAALPVFGRDGLPLCEVAALAYLVASPGGTDSSPTLSCSDPVVALDIADTTAPLGVQVAERWSAPGGPDGEVAVCFEVHWGDKACQLARRHRVSGPPGSRRVPEAVYRLPRHQLAWFLNRVFALAGSTWAPAGAAGQGRVILDTANDRLARDLQHLLLRFGVCATVRDTVVAANDETWVRHELEVAGAHDLTVLAEEIGITGQQDALRALATHAREAASSSERTLAAAGAGSALAEDIGARELRWDVITSIEADGEEQVYDLTVPVLQNFVAADVFVHNTSFALGMAANAALEHHRPVLFFSLEMGSLELSQRLLCAEARIDSSRVRSGQLQADDWTKVSRAMGRLAEAPIWIDDNPNLTIVEIRAKARRLKSRIGDLGLIVVDYLQLMTGRARAENRQVEVAELSRGLKILARELQTPVVALSQLSRGLEARADKRPMLADLRESGCLTADARVLRADTGAEVTMGELVLTGARNIPVWSLDRDLRVVAATMTKAFPSGVKPVFELRTASGRRLRASANHPFLTVEGWRRLDELVPGARIAAPARIPEPLAPRGMHRCALARLARLAATGDEPGAERASARLAPARPANPPRAALVAPFGPHAARVSASARGGVAEAPPRGGEGLIPASVFRLPDDQVVMFLRHLWATGPAAWPPPSGVEDASAAGGVVGAFSTASRRLAEGLQLLLLRAATQARVREVAGADGHAFVVEVGADGLWLLDPDGAQRLDAGRRKAPREGASVLWDEVVAIELHGEEPVYDATVIGTHNFVANGITVENSIEQDSDVVMFIYREEVYDPKPDNAGHAEIIVAKHRSGPTGVVQLAFLPQYTRFANMARGFD